MIIKKVRNNETYEIKHIGLAIKIKFGSKAHCSSLLKAINEQDRYDMFRKDTVIADVSFLVSRIVDRVGHLWPN